MNISLRSATAEDAAFQFGVYMSTRTDELAAVPWTDEQKVAFLRMQFEAQARSYRLQFSTANWSIVLRDETPVGRLIVHRTADEIRLVDVALLSSARGAGIGTALIHQLQAEAAGAGLPLRLHVEAFNRAAKLYRRLGFRPINEHGLHIEMEWRSREWRG